MLASLTRFSTVIVPLVLAVVIVLPSTSWAFNAYLNMQPDCAGPVTAVGLVGSIQLNGFTSKAINTGSISSGGGGGVGKAVISPIQVLKDFDHCSPRIFADVVIGRHLQKVTIVFTRPSRGREEPFFKITLSDVLITGVEGTTVAKTSADDLRNIQDSTAPEVNTGDPTALQEIVTLTFGRIELADLVTNTPPVTFDISENRAQ